ELPAPRHDSLRDFRVGYVLDDAYCPVTPETKAALEKTIQALEKVGAKLKPGWPAGFKIEDLYENYMFHLDAFMLSSAPGEAQEAAKKEAAAHGETPPGLRSFAEWQGQNFKRLGFRQQWQKYFEDVDVFLSPVAFATTFPHDQSQPIRKRTITTATGQRKYGDL